MALKIILVSYCYLLTLNTMVAQTLQQPPVKDSATYTAVETEAAYPGGAEAWVKYIQKNINNKVPEADAPAGKYTAIVRFIVDKNGAVSNAAPETKFGYGMEEEVLRVVESSGKWTPAMQNGKPVNAYRRQPITFLKESADFTIITTEPYTLYANTDNEVTINARKVAPENISISVTGGKVLAGTAGKFIIRVSKPGRAIIEITNVKKDDQLIGTASIEVKSK